MNALLILLLTPFISGALLALFGHTKRAAEINAAGSLVTLLAAAPLAFEVVNEARCSPSTSCSSSIRSTSS